MLLKLLLKIWPALLPIAIYCLWILVRLIVRKIAQKKAGKIIDGVFSEVKKDEKLAQNQSYETKDRVGDFSLHNRKFILVLYSTLFIAIICFLFFAIRVPRIVEGEYIPAHIENGKIIPAEIIKKE